MSATLLIISLISGGAIAFFVRFLVALHNESRGLQIERPTIKRGARMDSTSEYRKPDRQTSAIVRIEHKIGETAGHSGDFSTTARGGDRIFLDLHQRRIL